MLVLHPGAVTSARLVRAVESLGDDALEASLLRRGEHRLRPANEVARHAPGGSLEREPLEQVTARGVWQVERGVAVEMEYVEREEARGRPGQGDGCCAAVRAKPPTQALEVGLTVGAEADELPVENHAPAAERLRHRSELWELGCALATGSRP